MFTRRLSGVWGVVSFSILALVVVSVLVVCELPVWIMWAGGLFAGILLLLCTISVFRGTAPRSGNFSTFEHNTLGNPVTEEFQAPYHSPIPFEASESILSWCAPIMQVASGLGDFFKGGSRSFLGKGKTADAENALIFTQKRLLFLMIGPDSLQRFSPDKKNTGLLQRLPGDASAKRRMLWQFGAQEVRDALVGLLEKEDLEHLARTHYSFTIPLDHIKAVDYSLDTQVIKVQLDGLKLHYWVKIKTDLAGLTAEMTNQGIAVNSAA